MYPDLHVPAFFDFHGRPAVIQSQLHLPQVWNPATNAWDYKDDPLGFLENAERITGKEFENATAGKPAPAA